MNENEKKINETLQMMLSAENSCDNIEELRVALEEMQKKQIIQEHEKRNAIFESNGLWFTHFVTPDGKRSTIRRKTRKELEDALYKKIKGQKETALTFKKVYEKWIAFKQKETSLSNANRLDWAWKKYFANSELAEKSMQNISVSELKSIMIDICRKYELNSAQAKDMKSIINMMFDFAIENDWLTNNPSRSIHGFANESKDYIAISKTKSLDKEVFNEEEETAAIKKCYEMFQQTHNTIYLGIILNFLLGLRVGELIACKFEDFRFNDNTLHLCRSEVRKYTEDGMHKDGFTIKPYLKKHVPYRDIPIGKEVFKLVSMIKQANIDNGFENSEWLFIDEHGKLRHSKAFHKALTRINVKADIMQKSNHKIRKTVISKLIGSGQMSIVDIRDFAGHKDEHTTLKFYGRNVRTTEEAANIADDVLGPKVAI